MFFEIVFEKLLLLKQSEISYFKKVHTIVMFWYK